ncbi:MAG: hypothetical protein P8049_04140, partial [Gemmatimonadota bacterium]
MSDDRRCLVSGAAAGLAGGVFLLLFYLLIDALRGEPLATAAFLAGGLFGTDPAQITVVRYGLLTVVHLTAFVMLGVLACVLTEVTPLPRSVLVGAVYGLFANTLLFYLALIMSGARIVDAPAWPVAFAGNILAGIVIMSYLRRVAGTGATELAGSTSESAARAVVREGVIAGLIGATTVAVWFLVIDLIVGRAFFTPAALGSAMLYGAAASDAVVVSAGTVIGYSVYHVAAFTFIGIVVAALLALADRFPPLYFGMIVLFVVFETFVVFLAALLGEWILEQLAWWAIVAGNVLAAVAMGSYLASRHPELRENLRDEVMWSGAGNGP